jgi:hypothetical protein
MDEIMTFSEHVDVMVAKAFAMLEFIRRLSLEFSISLYSKVSLHVSGSSKTGTRKLRVEPVLWCSCWQSGTRAKAVYSKCFPWFGLDRHAWFATVRGQMRILTPLQKGDRLLVWCLFSMFWVGECTHQACCPFSIWSRQKNFHDFYVIKLVIHFEVNKIQSNFQVHRFIFNESVQKNIPSPFRILGLWLIGCA